MNDTKTRNASLLILYVKVAADYCILIGAGCVWAGRKDRRRVMGTDLGDAWVGALDILTGQV